MADLVRYTSIENHYQQGFIERSPNEVTDWIVTEKIHGANFQIYYDGENYRIGSRNRFIDNESFNNIHNILEPMWKDIKELCEGCKSPELPVTLYGEVYGDGVQKGVHYSKEKKVVFFDIKAGEEYLPADISFELLELHNLPLVPIISTPSGTLAEVIEQVDTEFNSKLAEGEYAELTDNICEGVVIKPYFVELKTVQGSRVIIKKKNEKFFENQKTPTPRQDKFVDYKEDFMKFSSYVNDNRFDAVFSKEPYHKKNFAQFLGDYTRDVIEDMDKEGLKIENSKNLTNYIAKLSKVAYFSRV